jgi:hypothetical protein
MRQAAMERLPKKKTRTNSGVDDVLLASHIEAMELEKEH